MKFKIGDQVAILRDDFKNEVFTVIDIIRDYSLDVYAQDGMYVANLISNETYYLVENNAPNIEHHIVAEYLLQGV